MPSNKLIPLLTIAGFLLAFGLLAQAASAHKPTAIDAALMNVLRTPGADPVPIGPAWLQEAARDVTSLGSVTVVLTITFAIAGYLFLARKLRVAWLMLVAVLGGLVLNSLLKFAFARPRPEVVAHAPRVFTTSFPSGHATLSAIAYLTIAALLSRTSNSVALSVYFLSLAVFLAVLVGLSRVYLGVHYPTDVFGGWCVGAAWAIACWSLMASLQQAGRVEPPSP